jgi:hypothetical protein
MDRIQRKRVVAKSKMPTRTVLCNCLLSSFNRASANIPRTAFLSGLRRRKVPITPVHCTELVLGDERGARGEPKMASTNRLHWIE